MYVSCLNQFMKIGLMIIHIFLCMLSWQKVFFFCQKGKNMYVNKSVIKWPSFHLKSYAGIYSINSSCSKCADKMNTFSSCIIYVDCKILRMSQSTSFHHENSTVPSSQIMVASLQDETENHRVVSYRRWSLPCYQ